MFGGPAGVGRRERQMNSEEFLKAFHELSPEDQQAIRAELLKAEPESCSAGEMTQRMMEMMKKIQASENPMECCKEMMGMCQGMMQRMGARQAQ
jgi:hypothetical protein